MARIGRTIYTTHCEGIGFDENNNVININVDILGNINDIKRANGIVRHKLNNNRITLKSISATSRHYSMPLEKFIEQADIVTEHDN